MFEEQKKITINLLNVNSDCFYLYDPVLNHNLRIHYIIYQTFNNCFNCAVYHASCN